MGQLVENENQEVIVTPNIWRNLLQYLCPSRTIIKKVSLIIIVSCVKSD